MDAQWQQQQITDQARQLALDPNLVVAVQDEDRSQIDFGDILAAVAGTHLSAPAEAAAFTWRIDRTGAEPILIVEDR